MRRGGIAFFSPNISASPVGYICTREPTISEPRLRVDRSDRLPGTVSVKCIMRKD